MSFAYFPFYTGDYYRDTRHLSMLQHGAYRQLLDHCWDQKGPLPLDLEKCYRICGAVSKEEQECVRGIISEFFVCMDDGHYQKRVMEEVAKAEQWSQKSREGGLKSAITRRSKARKGAAAKRNEPPLNHPSTTVQPPSVSPSPSPSPSLTPSPTYSGEPPGPPQPTVASGKPARKRAVKPVSGDVWEAYCFAYKSRYQVEPVRNAKVNSQLSQLVGRLGDEAAEVAGFYVSNRNGLYVASKHCTDLLLRDAEKLRTEWATGNVTHGRDAREEDRLSATGAMWDRVGERLKAKGIV